MSIQSVQSLLTYTSPTATAGPAGTAAGVQLNAMLTVLLNTLPDQGPGDASAQSSSMPDWDQMSPRMAAQLRAEIAAIQAKVTAWSIT